MRRIVIVEDHRIVREGLKLLFSTEKDYEVIADFDSGEAFLNHMKASGPLSSDRDFTLLLDITLPGKSGLEVLRFMKALYPQIPVLILSMHQEESMAVRALRAGASGYVQKDADPEALKTALQTVSVGGKYVSPTVACKLVDHLHGNTQAPPHEKLSEREFEVLLLFGGGMGNSEVAERLSLSPKTVSTYKKRVLRKLGLKTTADMVRYMVDHSLFSLKE